MALRPELRRVRDRLFAEAEVRARSAEAARVVSLDAVGDALGALSVSLDEIDALIAELESAGVSVVAPEGGGGEQRLGRVVAAARALREAGASATLTAIASHTGLSHDQVRQALALARVMQR